MDDLNRSTDQLIETVLQQRPLTPLPAGFVERVLVQIQVAPAQITREVFRYKLETLDLALPILGFCLMLVALVLTGQLESIGIASPVDWAAVLPQAGALPNWFDLVGLFVFAEICAGVLFCTWLWLDWPLPLASSEA